MSNKCKCGLEFETLKQLQRHQRYYRDPITFRGSPDHFKVCEVTHQERGFKGGETRRLRRRIRYNARNYQL